MEGSPDRRHTTSVKSAGGNFAAFQEKKSRKVFSTLATQIEKKICNAEIEKLSVAYSFWSCSSLDGSKKVLLFKILISQRGTAKKLLKPTESNPTSVLN